MPQQNENESVEPIIKLIESQKIIDGRFYDIRRIDPNAGDGNFSLVFKARDKESKKQRDVILKFFNPFRDNYRRQSFQRESEILRDLRGQRNILPLVQELKQVWIPISNSIKWPLDFYSSHLAKCSVGAYIYNQPKDFLKNIVYFREICKAVQRIHKKSIYHRDLKPDNFLIFQSGYVCLSDFGTARYFGLFGGPILPDYIWPVGDMRYTAPELLGCLHFSDYHNRCADIYSLGSILFELFTKNILGLNIFREGEAVQFSAQFNVIPQQNRLQVFDKFINGFAESRKLPDVRLFDPSIPTSLAIEIDKLYKSMAHLDYRERQTNFDIIFSRINICEKILRNLKEYERWKSKKS